MVYMTVRAMEEAGDSRGTLTMDNTIIDRTGSGVASGSLAGSALGMGGRSEVGDLTPSSSS